MVSVILVAVCSSLETTSLPRRLRSSTSELPVDLSVLFTSSPRVAMVSASRLEESTSVSLICWERSSINCTTAEDFCAKPWVTSSSRVSISCVRFAVSSENSSVMWSVLKFRLDVNRSLALAMALPVVHAGALQALQQVAAALAERRDHGVAGIAERERDVLALLGERLRDLVRAVVDARGYLVADGGDVARKAEMDGGDGAAHLLALRHQHVALLRERVQQAADAQLVVVVGAFQRGNLVGDERFELGGARQRALDAVAHGGDLAADRLADGHDRLAGDLFGLRQAHRDAGHGLRDQAQLLRPPHHVRERVEEQDRPEHEHAEAEERGPADRTLTGRLQVGQIDAGQNEAAGNPRKREDRGDEIGRARRLALQGLQDLADGLAVIVGGRRAGRFEGSSAPGPSNRSRSAVA